MEMDFCTIDTSLPTVAYLGSVRHSLGAHWILTAAQVTLLPEFATSFSTFRYLSSLTIDPVYRSRSQAPASAEHKHLIAWHTYCPTLRYFNAPTGRQWVYMPTVPSPDNMLVESSNLGQWTVVFEPALSESTFATDPGLFGMRRAGGSRERFDGGSVEELVAIIERLNRERGSGQAGTA
ncbi:hypothetical protein FRC08_015130 [Ceratobasidium sp. 394]|nr:hypothetical protein FRC08_015130 [Ceratobasidium sp. 394]